MKRARGLGLILFLLNTAYIAAFATPFTRLLLQRHPAHVLGIALAVAYGIDLRAGWRQIRSGSAPPRLCSQRAS